MWFFVWIYIYIYIYLCVCVYLRVSPPLAGLIPAPHARTHTDGGQLTPVGIDGGTSGVKTHCPNRANTGLAILLYFNLS